MDENPWYSSAEEYRAVQSMVREGRYREAADRAQRALVEGHLGRKHAARLHSQLCWILLEQLQEVTPVAIMHGEEAVRLAELAGDAYVRCEALCRLVHAYSRVGDIARARATCAEVARAVDANDAVIIGGVAELRQLEAVVSAAAGDAAGCLLALKGAEGLAAEYAPGVGYRIKLQRLLALLEYGRLAEARRMLDQGPPASGEEPLEWALGRAWLAVAQGPVELAEAEVANGLRRAREAGDTAIIIQCLALEALVEEQKGTGRGPTLARLALERCVAAGRVDLARSLRRRLGRLLA